MIHCPSPVSGGFQQHRPWKEPLIPKHRVFWTHFFLDWSLEIIRVLFLFFFYFLFSSIFSCSCFWLLVLKSFNLILLLNSIFYLNILSPFFSFSNFTSFIFPFALPPSLLVLLIFRYLITSILLLLNSLYFY